MGLAEAADGQVVGNRDVKRVLRLGCLGADQLHQGVQAVEGQGVRVVDGGPDLLRTAIAADGKCAVADLLDERLGGFLDVFDELFQHS